jgi:hypothetical protein
MKRLSTALSYLQEKHFDKWLPGYCEYLLEDRLVSPVVEGCRHLLFAVCDHYEPLSLADYPMPGRDYLLPEGLSEVPHQVGLERVAFWEDHYPTFASSYRDSGGHAPRHSFFFPLHEYHPMYLESLGRLVEQGLGEVEIHIHHEDDTPEGFRDKLLHTVDLFSQFGHLSQDESGRHRYGFIHGNWCLCNARSDGRMCGVDNELEVLFETGCYADFTFPAAPDEAQPNIVNQIYWPQGDLSKRRAYELGERARVGKKELDRILMVQGPLGLSWRRHWLPVKIESAHLTATEPPNRRRVRDWVHKNIHVAGRPEWVFVKIDTHGALEATARSLFGQEGHELHTVLQEEFNDGTTWKLHYVTAREMYNIARAAMDGLSGDPELFRDYVLPPPQRAQR